MPDESPNLYPELRNGIEDEIIKTQYELTRDYAEILLDQTFQEDVVKELPWVKTIYSIYKVGLNLGDRSLVKKIAIFIKSFNDGTVTDEEKETFTVRLNESPKFKQRVFDYTIQLNDRFLQIEKSAILGRLFSHYFKGNINWKKYQLLSEILDTQTLYSLRLLTELAKRDFTLDAREVIEEQRSEDFMSVNGLFHSEGYVQGDIIVSAIGRELFEYGVRPIDLG